MPPKDGGALPADAGQSTGPGSCAHDFVVSEPELRSLLLDLVSDAIICHTLDGCIVYANEAACMQRGYTCEEFIGMRLGDVVSVKESERVAERVETLLREGSMVFESEDVTRDGSAIPIEVHARIAEVAGVQIIISIIRDISERKRAQAEIESLAFRDTLTGLPNRRMFMDRARMTLSNARRTGENVALLFLDIDYLKRVNDQLGHRAGDRLLSLVGMRLSDLVRTADTVARLSGDEFVVLMPGIRDATTAEEVASKILAGLKEPLDLDGTALSVTASIGVALNDPREIGVEEMLARADGAMYAVKSGSRNAYALHVPKRAESPLDGYELEGQIARAINRDELVLYYQPQVILSDGRVECVEALIRWDHPVRGLIMPDRFVALAEESGQSGALGRWVIRTACRQHSEWLDSGLPAVRIAVNISYRQMLQPGLVDVVEAALAETGMDARYLELELNEMDIVRANETVRRTLGALRERGVRLAVSGFGEGYLVRGYVHGVPVDTLKIHRCQGSELDAEAGSKVSSAILALADGLALNTVVECVEDERQLREAARGRSGGVQGHVFSRALPPHEVAALIRDGFTTGTV
ncbi:MAG: EAL domain-containing protein [Clostridiales bacterium]|nr:EAL domain-containing protein [Clostridiales bacterium]